MVSTTPSANDLLDADKRRQAFASLDGYAYQIWRSVFEWLTLDGDEALDLEGNEDIDRLRPGEATTIQVKHTARPLSLRSDSVIQAIGNYWSASDRNSSKRLRMRFLSTANPTEEQGNPFGDKPGLKVWKLAAGGTDKEADEVRAQQIGQFLLGLPSLPIDLKSWLSNSSPGEILKHLIVPIEWDLGAAGTDVIKGLIDKQLILVGEIYGVMPTDAAKVRPRLLEQALAKATHPSNRRLLRADMLSLFEAETMRLVPARMSNSMIQAMVAQAAPTQSPNASNELLRYTTALRVSPSPLPVRFLQRRAHVDAIVRIAAQQGFVYVSGSTGLGKSTLVELAARRAERELVWLDLRGLEESAPQLVRRAVTELLGARTRRTLVVDDLSFTGDSRPLQDAVIELVTAMSTLGGLLYATGANELPPRLRSKLGIDKEVSFLAEPLTELEIEELLVLHGCPAGRNRTNWAKLTYAYTRGHPQLVDARVHALRQKGFPKLTDADIVGATEDISEVRSQSRLLIGELSKPDRELLYRLSLTIGRFSREVAIKVSTLEPAIEHPGDAFDRLTGPWIERIGGTRFRISPLVVNAGFEANGNEWAQLVHVALAEAHRSKTMWPDDVNGVLFHATVGRDEKALVSMCAALITSRRDLAKAANWLDWFIDVDSKNSPVKIASSFFGRAVVKMVQFYIAAGRDAATALEAANALDEATRLRNKNPSINEKMVRVMALHGLVLERSIPLNIRDILTWIVEASELAYDVPKLRKTNAEALATIYPDIEESADWACVLTTCLHQKITTVVTLKDLLDGIDELRPQMRERILAPFSTSAGIAQYIVDPIWLNEFKAPRPDWRRLVDELVALLPRIRAWKSTGLQAAITTVVVRVLNENLEHPAEAQAFAENSIAEIGSDPCVIDALADTYDRSNNPAEAYRLRSQAMPTWLPVRNDWFGPAMGRRKAAISAARIENWAAARSLFVDAALIASRKMNYLAAGLYADGGHAAIRAGNQTEGATLLLKSIQILKAIPNTPDKPRPFRTHKSIGHLVNWLSHINNTDAHINAWEPPPGSCSSSEVTDELLKLPQTPREYSIWNLCRYSLDFIEDVPNLRAELESLRATKYTSLRFLATNLEADCAVLRRDFVAVVSLSIICGREFAWSKSLLSPNGSQNPMQHQSDALTAC